MNLTTRHATLLSTACASVCMVLLCGCKNLENGGEDLAEDALEESAAAGMLASMSFAEAAAISPKKLEVPPFFRVAADEIEIVRERKDGSPRTVRAKGKVFLDISFREGATALCQEAYFGDDEVILRGHPLLQRGGSRVEGLSDSTVFYMLGTRLRVIGLHRVAYDNQMYVHDLAGGGGSHPRQFIMNNIPLPMNMSKWEGGPNPLLPPLSPASVPDKIRSEMQKAAEAEAVLQQSRIDPVAPLQEESAQPPKQSDKKSVEKIESSPAPAPAPAPSEKPAAPEKPAEKNEPADKPAGDQPKPA